MKLKCYYSHTMTSYDSTIEQEDIELLERLGFEVVNPNSPDIQSEMEDYINMYGKQNVMDYFKSVVRFCDVVAFRAIPNGDILSGVSAELEEAIEEEIPIIELPCSLQSRMMDYPETKQYLIELGHYKVKKR
jgi:hypothetical protein